MLKFIVDEPALVIGKTLVIADLHLGFEYELLAKGINIPSQSESMLKKIKRLLRENKCKELIIIGDLKHTIANLAWPEQEEIADFMGKLEKLVRVQVVKGNHDGNIENYLKQVHPPQGFDYKGYWIMHGHAKPPASALKKTIIMGHIHPVVRFKDRLGGSITEQVWVIAKNVIVMPAFNELPGGVDARELDGAMAKLLHMERAELYLLDGLNLGKISQLKRRGYGKI